MTETVKELYNQIPYKIEVSQDSGQDSITFYLLNGKAVEMHHEQDCCEEVYIEDISGNLDNLIGHPILRADEKITQAYSEGASTTATFYTLASEKTYVDIRWQGVSNGYYSESVDFNSYEYPVPEDIKELYSKRYPEYIL